MAQNITDIYPLSPLQQDMLFDAVYASKRSAHGAYIAFRVNGELQVAFFQQAWQKIMERYPVLRTAFVWERVKKPLQVVRTKVVLPWDERDWRGLDEEQQERQLQQYLDGERQRGFNPGQAPLTRLALIRLEDNQYQFVWTYSNLCLDARSTQIICQDLFAHYRSLSKGRESDFPTPRPFRDFIALLQQQDRAGAEVFWRGILQGVVPAAPFAIEASRSTASADPQYRNIFSKLDRATTEKLRAAARSHGLDVNTFVQGAWAWLLSCYGGSDDVVFGVASRAFFMAQEGVDSITGVTLDIAPVRIGVGRHEEVLSQLKKLQTYHSEARKYGCSSVTEIKGWSRVSEEKPLFETVLAFESHPPTKDFQINGDLTFVPGPIHSDMQYPVTLKVEVKEELSLCLVFEARRLTSETASEVLHHVENILSEMAINVERKWESISVGPVDRKYPVYSGNGSTIESVQGKKGPMELGAQAAVKTQQKSRLGRQSGFVDPESAIPPNCAAILPGMLPLVELSEEEIERIVNGVPGGAENIQDIYPLMPLQEGILFHHLMSEEGDPYLLARLMSFKSRMQLDACANAMQAIVDRHDIMRTAIVWEGLREPVQVVCRKVKLPVEEVVLNGTGGAAEQLLARYSPRHHRIDVRQAPLMRIYIAKDEQKRRWLMLVLLHHLLGDHSTWDAMGEEVEAHLLGLAAQLPRPEPFRNLVAQARLGVSQEEHKAFFRQMLGDIEEPTLPFGLTDVQGDGQGIEETFLVLGKDLELRVREGARKLGVSPASVCHAAWAQVLAKVSGREDVVFGTVRFGRMGGGAAAERGMGLFMNTLPIRIRVGAEEVKSSVRSAHRQLSELLRHEHASLTLAQKCSGVPTSVPLFSSLLNYRNTGGAAEKTSNETRRAWDGMQRLGGEERTNYPVTMSLNFGNGITLWAQTARPVDPERVCRYMSRALELLTEALQNETRRAMWTLDVLPEEERRQLLYEWNGTKTEYGTDKCIHELFEHQAERHPEAAAVVFEQRELNYEELNHESNKVANELVAMGVGPEVLVGICMERSIEMVVGLLAILKVGGAYVPLDPESPRERVAGMMEEANLKIVLTQERFRGLLSGAGNAEMKILVVRAGSEEGPGRNVGNPKSRVEAGNLAYVIYTSGSTGKPKGAMNTHGGIRNRLLWMQDAYGLQPGERVLQKTPFTFDVSVWEFFWPLVTGACLVVARPGEHRNPEYLVKLIEQEEISTVHFVPSMFGAFLQAAEAGSCQCLRRVICSGEALPVGMAEEFLSRFSARLYNLYGPTEAAVDVTYWECLRRGSGATIPIGRPIANLQMYVLNQELQPVPVGVTGELYIGGVGVGRGYLNRPELTAERFLPDPFRKEDGRMYRTGDLARWRNDGAIEFLGRNDFQVKIRGNRVELGEIEARLLAHKDVKQAAVVVREDAPGNKRLVAYYAAKGNQDNDNNVDSDALRTYLAGVLPDYMIPAAFVRLEQLPQTSSGKLNRKSLPAPGRGAFVGGGYQEPVGEVESSLAGIWKELLQVERVGRDDNFFRLGGDSLLAIRVMEAMRRKGLQADVRTVFTVPTLAGLASAVSKAEAITVPENRIPAGCAHITPEMLPLVEVSQEEINKIVSRVPGGDGNVQDIYPLAPLQEGILFHHLVGKEGDPYLSALLFSVDSRERLDRYREALQAVVDRHDILRTGIAWEGLRELVQVVWRRAELPVEEVVLGGGGDAAEEISERFSPRHYRIDVQRAPLLRIYIAKDEQKQRWLGLLLLHHLVGDQRTLAMMEHEIGVHLLGDAEQLPKPQPFRNFVAQARLAISQEEHKQFFQQMLGDVDEPTLPFGLMEVQKDWNQSETTYERLDKSVGLRIREVAQRLGVTAASVCHAAWARVLAKVSGREDVVFGTVLVGRMAGGEATERGLGLFINTLPIRLRVGSDGVETSVRGTHRLLAELVRYEHASLALAQKCSGVPAPTPPFSALLNFRNARLGMDEGSERAPGEQAQNKMKGIEILKWEERTNYPLTLAVDFEEKVGLLAQAAATVDPKRMCGYMARALESLMDALESGDKRTMRTVDVLPAAEREQILMGWNRTQAEYPTEKCMHELFEEQVEKTPEKVAVEFEDAYLTYGELNRRANRLAHYLRELGVRPEVRVVLCMERSLEVLISILGVWKAGGAYVPLDPAAPAERLEFMLQDCSPVAILTQAHLQKALHQVKGNAVIVNIEDLGTWNEQPKTNPDSTTVGLCSRHPAYIIYTSGSTGKPKGVVIEHRSVCNQISALHAQVGTRAQDRLLQFTAFIFDPSVEEIFNGLLAGATLILRTDAWLAGGQQFWRLVEDRGVTLMDLPTRFWGQILPDQTTQIPLSVRQVMIGGEAVERKALENWFESENYRPPLWNSYGPTEITVNATLHPISADPANWNSIGGPMENTRLYVLDAGLEPVPIGVAGELYIAGAGVARGYWNRLDLTAERFLSDPFVQEAGARMYKTGDLVRWLADGTVEFLGRNDFQVKIRGFRIELEEIEARLEAYPGVRQAVVMAREQKDGEKWLVAYYTVAADCHEELGAKVLRTYLAGELPEYMVPAAYVRLEKLPQISHGKLDRKALPEPDAAAYVAHRYEEPVGEIETTIAKIWAEVLHVEKVGRHDDFFKLGGHSLLAMRLTAIIRNRLNCELSLIDVFQNPTIATMSQWVTHSTEETRTKNASLLVPIQSKGSRPAFFCVHPVGGQVACYANLSRELGTDQPFYGIQSPSADSPMATIESMAFAYNREIRRVQPQGPYFLGGWSMGGLIAWEMARQLTEEKQEVGLLVLIDTDQSSHKVPDSNGADDPPLFLTLASDIYQAAGKNIDGLYERYSQLDPKMQRQFVLENLKREGLLAKENAEQMFTDLLAVFTRNVRADQRYAMKPTAQDIVLIRAADTNVNAEDWARWTVGKIDQHTIRGNHYTILRQPAVSRIAEILSNHLDSSLQRPAMHGLAMI